MSPEPESRIIPFVKGAPHRKATSGEPRVAKLPEFSGSLHPVAQRIIDRERELQDSIKNDPAAQRRLRRSRSLFD